MIFLTPNFRLDEFRCSDGTPVPKKYLANVHRLCEQLEVIRAELNRPVTILSGYRTLKHNLKVGGAKTSQHLYGRAADIVIAGVSAKQVADTIEALIGGGLVHDGGLGRYRNFTHYDVRAKSARWKG